MTHRRISILVDGYYKTTEYSDQLFSWSGDKCIKAYVLWPMEITKVVTRKVSNEFKRY